MLIVKFRCSNQQYSCAGNRQGRPIHFPVFSAIWRRIVYMCFFMAVLYLIFPCPVTAQPLTIITDPYPPLGYVDKNGKIGGFTVDIINLLLERTGIEGKFEMYPWARAYEMAQKEKNILIYQLTYTKERSLLFQLVGPVFSSRYYFFKMKNRKDIVVTNLENAKSYLVGTVRDYFTHRYLLKNGFEEGNNLEVAHEDSINLKKLVDHRIDLMILIDITFPYRVKELGYQPGDFEKTFLVYSEDAYLGFSKQTSPKVVSQFVKELKIIKKDGSYNSIRKKYGISGPKNHSK